ncbi:hypothetical protein HNO53_13025 [Billgrantia antri]|uniref:Uncharacterized protein n=1 Tax=Halomonas sulfidivorans TaxID=2733488 RepID=A0ABX7WGM1_9GAMM|nr:hypothetical protein [Halomonas sulfidivorans]QTP59558.1 hypothetical protein HNO53_13025 [Halomonas sulfidivorans]
MDITSLLTKICIKSLIRYVGSERYCQEIDLNYNHYTDSWIVRAGIFSNGDDADFEIEHDDLNEALLLLLEDIAEYICNKPCFTRKDSTAALNELLNKLERQGKLSSEERHLILKTRNKLYSAW